MKEYESLIWQIEDHEYCLNGRLLGNINISHLIDLSKNPSFEELTKVKDLYLGLVDFKNKDQQKTLTRLLLHYGDFYYRHTPYYYHKWT